MEGVDKHLLKIHICGKIDQIIIKNIFPESCTQKKDNILIGDRQWKTAQFNWVAKIYNEKENDLNFKNIFLNIQNDSDLMKDKITKHVILSFGDEDNEKLFEQLLDIGIVYLPRIIFITKNVGKYNFNKQMFITNIIYTGLSQEELICNIHSELWEIDCYYNERGNETCKFLANNILENIEISDFSINLLLAGISRAGKSSFINIINNSLLALENCEKSSITSKISEYHIFGENKTDKDGFIKIIDTPGFNYETNKKTDKKELVNLEQINQGIFNLIKEYREKSSKDNIHYVLFFFMEGTPLEGTQRVLSMFLDEHYPVLFIINKSINEDDNGETSDIKSTIKFLKNNGLGKLAIRENIIPCNIVNSKRCSGYGIELIFKRILALLTEKNNFYYEKDILNKLKECNDKMKNYLNVKGEEEQYNKYLNDSIVLKKRLTDNNELFKKYDGEEYIIEEGRKGAEKLKKIYMGLTASQAYIPIPYTDMALTPVLQAKMIYSIFSGYGTSLTNIDFSTLAKFLLEEGGREIGHIGYNYASKQIFSETAKGCLMTLSKMIIQNQGAKAATESVKFIPFIGFLLGSTIGSALNLYSTKSFANKSILFCEKYLRDKGSLNFLISRLEILNNIFKEIERLSKKNNWWDFKVKVIKKE